jgi:ribosomal protein S18 acetylase RimI-like enzyme
VTPVTLAAVGDVPAIARLHADRIEEGFLATLGRGFLERLYRRAVLSAHAFIVAARSDDGRVVGFVATSTDTSAFYKDFLRHDAVVAGFVAAPRLMRHPRHVWETLRYGTVRADTLPPAEILSTAVASDHEGRGIGRSLVAAALRELAEREVSSAYVVTGSTNSVAIAMYTRAGFRRFSTTEVHRGVVQEALLWP